MTTLLDSKINKLSPQDEKWVTFVRDHTAFLKTKSEQYIFTVADIDRFGNRMDAFYADKGVGSGQVWIEDKLGVDFRIWIADFGFKVFYLFY